MNRESEKNTDIGERKENNWNGVLDQEKTEWEKWHQIVSGVWANRMMRV